MVEFYGTVPGVTNAIRGIPTPDPLPYHGGFDKMENVLRSLGTEYQDQTMLEAARIFAKGAPVMTQIKDVVVDYIIGEEDRIEVLPELYTKVMNINKAGYQRLEDC